MPFAARLTDIDGHDTLQITVSNLSVAINVDAASGSSLTGLTFVNVEDFQINVYGEHDDTYAAPTVTTLSGEEVATIFSRRAAAMTPSPAKRERID